ncbi:hypothetical protein IU449_16960 [Nocardia higoensis]|uniref:Excreted virulence factor EspC (Type VII ESX diderm) n=1 Tax=Nocardia higoensis TaxID=228599 RepID=A0ABS0DCL1_9NOCA|nr:hypothetical protein [Nocardia higoensis]MBF6356212.1 hypothetical protein [Nocardia higoensis]
MSTETLGVSTDELGRLANELRSSGEVVAGNVAKLDDNLFGAEHAGAGYSAQGRAIRAGLEALSRRIDDWSTATGATAEVIGAGAVEYSTVDRERSNRMNDQ